MSGSELTPAEQYELETLRREVDRRIDASVGQPPESGTHARLDNAREALRGFVSNLRHKGRRI